MAILKEAKEVITLKKVSKEDFEHIYPLLLGFGNPRLSKDDWRQLFENHWNNQEDFFGFALVDEKTKKYIGYLGIIFSSREINRRFYKFANMTSWIIDSQYRRKGLGKKLFKEVMDLEGYTFTDFTASPETQPLLKNNGFKVLETNTILIYPRMKLRTLINLFSYKPSILTNPRKVRDCLNKVDLKIYNAHLKFKCFHFLLKAKKKGETCYLVLHKTFRGKRPFLKVHYLSNLEVFCKYISRVIGKISLRYRVYGITVDKRFLKSNLIPGAVERQLPYKSVFKSNFLDKEHLNDTLFSEFILLNL